MEQVQQIIEHVSDTLSDVAQSDVVVGGPIEVGAMTVVPICRVTTGFGGGGGEGSGDMAKADQKKGRGPGGTGAGRGEGSGGGAIVRPVAVVVFGPDSVEVLPIAERRGKLEKLLDQLPDLVDRFKKSNDD